MQFAQTATDRRYQVFISSTFTDLRDERKAAIEGVFERGHIPIALERFSPANDSDLQVIEKAMASSQVYILILGHRYGEIISGSNISYTELEYDLAQSRGLLTLVFLMDDQVVAEKRKEFDRAHMKDAQELAHDGHFTRFRDKVKTHFFRPFRPGPEFKYIVQLALSDRLRDCPVPGFVLEPLDPTIVEGVRNEFIGAIVAELRSFEKLYKRLEQEKEKKRAAARFFVECYMDRLLAKKVSLFFESGSTVCFVAKAMSEALRDHVKLADDGSPSIQISTNNVLAYLLLWLNARIPCTKFPWSPPVETTYGAAYGGLENLQALSPDYTLPPLDDSALREIARLHAMPFSLSRMNKPTLLLGAASGLQIGTEPTLVFQDTSLSQAVMDALREQLRQCFGLHVGSYHNRVFKRFMYSTRLPIVIFMTSDKINVTIEVGKCHFILDRDYPWDQFATEHPVAFCIGCDTAEKSIFTD
ncbi:MAG TPA: DUF4062 domain-containing protein, partial [Thermoanaerobaculia bacterium]